MTKKGSDGRRLMKIGLAFVPGAAVNFEPEYRPRAWTIGFCPSCGQEGVARLEDVLEVSYLYGMRMDTTVVGEAARCDFCWRLIEEVRGLEGAPLADWSHEAGL